ITESYVVQEAVEIPHVPFPVALDGLRYLDLAVDLDPYLFNGRVGGFMTRVSAAALLNVTAGAGSVVPTFVVEGPACVGMGSSPSASRRSSRSSLPRQRGSP